MSNKSIVAEQLKESLNNAGLLIHKSGAGHLDFEFSYIGFPFDARAQVVDGRSSLDIMTTLGTMPYTAESLASRAAVARIMMVFTKKTGLKITVGQNQRLFLGGTVNNTEVLSPGNLLTMVTSILLQVKPFLEVLSDYIEPPIRTQDPDLSS
jgi:hypothetical protein